MAICANGELASSPNLLRFVDTLPDYLADAESVADTALEIGEVIVISDRNNMSPE